MNEEEAKLIIAKELESYRKKPYSELILMVDSEPVTFEITSESGAWYQLEIQAFWDNKRNGDVRVIGSIDEGKGWRAYRPLCDGFIKSPQDEFIGE